MNSASLRMLLLGVGALALGWILGFVTADSGDAGAAGPLSAAARAHAGSSEQSRGDSLVRSLGSGITPDDGEEAALLAAGTDPVARFDTLMRGALRITDNTDRSVRMRDIARAIPAAALPAAIEKAKKLPPGERWQVLTALGSRWAEEAPIAAAEFAIKEGGNRYGWNEMLNGVIDRWACIDQQAAAVWAAKQPEGRRMYLLQTMITSIARQDPEGALKLLSTQPGSNQMSWLHDQVFEQWSRRDPAGAAKAAESVQGAARERAIQSAASNWALQDPAAALSWAQGFADAADRNKLIRSVAVSWADQDPNAVLEFAAGIKEAGVRLDIVGAAISSIAQSDPDGAKARLRSMPAGQERDNLVNRVSNMVSTQDAKAGLKFLELLPEGVNRTTASAQLISRIAATDPDGAIELFAKLPASQLTYQVGQFAGSLATGNMEKAKEWVDQLSDPQMKTQALRSVASILSRSQPRQAAEWLLEKSPDADLTWLLNSWVRNSPKDVLAWSKDLPDGDAKRSAQAAVLQNMTYSDLELAKKTFAEELSPEAQVSSATQLASQWAARDVQAARAWAEALPPGGARDNALGGIARAWATQDATAAARWIERFTAGDERDRVVTHFAGALMQRDPAGALAWASSLADGDLRSAQLEQLAGRWLQTDAAAAREWINRAEQLSPNARRRILEQRSPGYQPYNQYYGGYYYDYN